MAEPGYSVCIFCGSRFGAEKSYRRLAEIVGRGLGERRWHVVYGGGDVGLMGVVAEAAMNAGAEVSGFIPVRLLDREVGKRDITRLEVTEDMFVRKRAMIERSSAFLALPGGLGTIDEILDAITLKQLGYHDKPILLMDENGFWQPFTDLIAHVVVKGFASASANELYRVCVTSEELWACLDQAATEAAAC